MSVNIEQYLEIAVGHISNIRDCVSELATAANWAARPSVLYRPTLSIDGNQWCALYGENLQEGIAGFGDTPADAMRRFDSEFMHRKAPQLEVMEAQP